jgi:replicative DNA helicase
MMPEPVNAEAAFLGIGLHHIAEFDALVAEFGLRRGHFEKLEHQAAWDALQGFVERKEQPDEGAFALELEARGVKPGFRLVTDLSLAAALTGTGRWYARTVKSHAAMRHFRGMANDLAKCAKEGDPEDAYKAMAGFTEEFGHEVAPPGPLALRAHMAKWLDHLEALQSGGQRVSLPLAGFGKLDSQIGGLIPGEMLLLCGPTSSGKSSLIRAMAVKLADAGTPIAILSLEDPIDAWINRAVADEARLDLRLLRSGTLTNEHYGIAVKMATHLANSPIAIMHIAGATTEQVLLGIKRLGITSPRYVFVDYLQAIHDGDMRGRHVELSRSLARIKAACGDIGASLVVASQISREAYKAASDKPPLWAAKETGDAENQAEAVAIIWCPHMREHEESGHVEDCVSLHVLKAKHGTRGAIGLRWTGWRTRYEER